jgi:hypothetical protein
MVRSCLLYFIFSLLLSSCGHRQNTPDIEGTDVKITFLQPFAGADNVRIECTVHALTETSDREVSAEIFDAEKGKLLWNGKFKNIIIKKGDSVTITQHIKGLRPNLWSPVSPHLYYLHVKVGDAEKTVRFGFRDFTMKDGQFYLNGQQIFLRGNAINPPGRGIPEEIEESREFAQDYIRFLKSININIIRIPNNQTWADVCDEEGMMLYGGRYGRPTTATSDGPPEDFEKAIFAYKNSDLGPLVRHPAMMIYTLSNEMPYEGQSGEKYRTFLSKAYQALKEWDPNRLYIGNAGYGLGKSADVYDVHRYWGWYYNSFLTYLNMRDEEMWQNEGRDQPVTFTECVGNYTGVDGRYNLCSRTKQPGSQKCWTGHIPDSMQSEAALIYQSFTLKNATELFRRFRNQNPKLAGIMPFTIMFYNWSDISTFDQMGNKPVTDQFRISYQPVLPSIELWKTQIYSGTDLDCIIHIVNDDDNGTDLTNARLRCTLESAEGTVVLSDEIAVATLPYYQIAKYPLHMSVPPDLETGHYTIKVHLSSKGKDISYNSANVFVANSDDWNIPANTEKTIYLYDETGKTQSQLSLLNIPFLPAERVKNITPESILIIGENSWDNNLSDQTADLRQFIRNGGRILCLKQHHDTFNTNWLPKKIELYQFSANDALFPEIIGVYDKMTYLSPSLAYRDGMNINLERINHPVLKGINHDNMKLWSDYTQYDESKPGFPQIYPVIQGFEIKSPNMENVAILANYSRALSGIALCEMFEGKGSVMLSGFDMVNHCNIDPVADRLFTNMVSYMSSHESHECYPLIDQPIIWGDYASEQGLVTGYYNGLLLNTVPVIPENLKDKITVRVDDAGYHISGVVGGWNNRPGIQYVAQGRRPFAPFSYSKGGNAIVGKNDITGEGHFCLRLPAGKKMMKTEVENPVNEPVRLSIQLNDGTNQRHSIPGNQTVILSTVIPGNSEAFKVKYSGDRKIVLRKTWFE